MSRALRFLVCGAMVCSLCAVSWGQADFEIPVVSTPPAIDGEVDEVWGLASIQYITIPVNNEPSDAVDSSGSFRALYDPEYLYVLIDVNDESLHNDTLLDNGWQDDSAEFYLDINNSKGAQGAIDDDDFQYRFNWNPDERDTYFWEYFHRPDSLEGVVAMHVDTGTGFRYEVKFPWETIAADGIAPMGGLIGIDCFINDDDDGGDTRESQIAWHATEGAGWNTPEMWGTAKLIAPLKATAPDPRNGADDVLVALMRWHAGRTAAFHDVYFGTTADLGPEHLGGDNLPTELYFHMGGIVPGTTYYWRVDEVEADGVTIHTGDVWSFTAQPKTAYKPDPADGSNTVMLTPDLKWKAGTGAATHQVYFSDAEAAVADRTADADKGVFTDPNFAPGALAELTEYFWAVDESGIGATVEAGAVWTFSTIAPIETFESYTDDIDGGLAIFQTWIDGVDNGTGSTVGYWEAVNGTFGETGIVYAGGQSMPLDYNNLDAPNYSETTRTFSPAENWTAGGAGELLLYIRGKSSNDVAPLYVAVDGAVVVHPDAEIVKALQWAEWKIPFAALTDAGANLSSVRNLTIGVGDPDNPVAGPQGLLYIDEIALALPTPAEE